MEPVRLNKIRDHALVVSHLRLTSDTRTRCCDVEHHLFSAFRNMFQNEREGNSLSVPGRLEPFDIDPLFLSYLYQRSQGLPHRTDL